MDSRTFPASRRMFLRAAVSAAVATIPRLAIAQDPATTSGEIDMFAYMVRTLGEPKYASRMSPDEAARYADRVPPALTQFWMEHGRGAYFDGLYWICDLAPFDSLLELIFEGDPEFNPSAMTVVLIPPWALKVWHRQRRSMNVSTLGVDGFQFTRKLMAQRAYRAAVF
jgi:hypothetical protein